MRSYRGLGAALLAAAAGSTCRPAPSRQPPLVTIEQARQLPAGSSVRLRGTLGLFDSATSAGYIQDGSAGLFLDAGAAPSVPAAGRAVEVEGVVEAQAGAPLLRARSFRIGGDASATPAPRKVAASRVDDAALSGTWVAAEGVVTNVVEHGGWHALRIEADGAAFTACVAEARQDRPAGHETLRGYHVRAQGVRVAPSDQYAADQGCTLRLPTRLLLRILRDAPRDPSRPVPALHAIETIRALSAADARQRQPVRIRGVVTTHDVDENLLFVQDHTAGIYVEAWRHLHDLSPGEYVEVTGRTGPGAFAPIVEWPHVEVLGRAPFPRPLRPTAPIAPPLDSQWIEIQGIVRSADIRMRRAVLEVMALGERLQVHVPGTVDARRVSSLVDAQVRLRGVYRATFTPRRQLVGVEIHVPSLDLVDVLAAPPADPYDAPLRRSDTILEFHPYDASGRRVHVRGVVTLHRPGRFLYLRDAGGPLRVETRAAAPLAPGDEIDVVGFPAIGEYRPVLQDASYRKSGRRDAPAPSPAPADHGMSGDLDGELVRIEGTLVERFAPEGETRLVLQSPLHVFEAALPGTGAFDTLRRGSRLSITGIGVVKGDAARVPQSFEILLRSPDDVTLLAQAPWWTPRRALLAMAGLVAVAAGAFLWVATLRRRVREQTEILRSRFGREAALEERTRLARELHDTLEQNLAGIGYALEAVKHTLGHPSVARSHLDRALGHVDQSMGEARRAVLALRSRVLENGDLALALQTLAGEVTRGGVARAEVDVQGTPWPLVPEVEDHLFRIGQEALTNALKHARADRLQVELRFTESDVELLVKDDGAGFDTGAAARDGHFGLQGMQERAAKVGARLDVRSAHGQGTSVLVSIPRHAASLPQVS